MTAGAMEVNATFFSPIEVRLPSRIVYFMLSCLFTRFAQFLWGLQRDCMVDTVRVHSGAPRCERALVSRDPFFAMHM